MHRAFQSRQNVSFETNFHTELVMTHVHTARAEGYVTTVLFLGLATSELATARVQKRAAQGGHFVRRTEVKARFEKGLNLLDKYFDIFDKCFIFESLDGYKVKRGYVIDLDGSVIDHQLSFIDHLPRIKARINQS